MESNYGWCNALGDGEINHLAQVVLDTDDCFHGVETYRGFGCAAWEIGQEPLIVDGVEYETWADRFGVDNERNDTARDAAG